MPAEGVVPEVRDQAWSMLPVVQSEARDNVSKLCKSEFRRGGATGGGGALGDDGWSPQATVLEGASVHEEFDHTNQPFEPIGETDSSEMKADTAAVVILPTPQKPFW